MNQIQAKLPPHSPEAEMGLLGSILDDATQTMPKVQETVREHQLFYDLRNQTLWLTLQAMFSAGLPITVDTVVVRLRDTGRLEDAGGLEHLIDIQAKSAGPSLWEYWVETLFRLFAARRVIALCAKTIESLQEADGGVDALIAQRIEEFTSLSELRRTTNQDPTRVKRPSAFGEDIFNAWFGPHAGEPGHELPFGFPWKIRTGELTLALGEKGKGKSTFLSHIMMHMMRKGMKGFIASMETRPEQTLKMIMTQLIGTSQLPNDTEGHRRFQAAMGWLQQRVVIYDYLGAVNYLELIQAMDHAANKLGCDFFIIDSLMRLGIADDDYAYQGMCVLRLANHAAQRKVQTMLVNHLNKSEGNARSRNRGSQQIVDNANNVISIDRNENKWLKISEIDDDVKSGTMTEGEARVKKAKLFGEWDARMVLMNQRWQGSVQNGSKALWFIRDALQYAEEPQSSPIDWLARWERRHKPEVLATPTPTTE